MRTKHPSNQTEKQLKITKMKMKKKIENHICIESSDANDKKLLVLYTLRKIMRIRSNIKLKRS